MRSVAAVPPKFGQDITFGIMRPAPRGEDVGKSPAELIPKMTLLLGKFARGDGTGMAQRLFDKFMMKQGAVTIFEDSALNAAAAKHPHIDYFCHAALSAPNSPYKSPGKRRIHQALADAQWDITKLNAPADLGVPAFNRGSNKLSTGDYNNGLGVMVNGIQYVYIIATSYQCDGNRYSIGLRYLFYDVFGLDDDDLIEYGAMSDSWPNIAQQIGITAWWQLQHQHGYAPLVTRIRLERTFEAPATP